MSTSLRGFGDKDEEEEEEEEGGEEDEEEEKQGRMIGGRCENRSLEFGQFKANPSVSPSVPRYASLDLQEYRSR